MRYLFFTVVVVLGVAFAKAQEPTILPEETKLKDAKTKYWFNTYGNVRIGKRLFWIAQTHFRFEESEDMPFAGQLGQIYNRHAIGWLYDKKFNAAVGGVLRLNFNTDESDDTGRNLVPEYRIWHQYQFAVPISSVMAYHRLRIEHRWTRGFADDSDFIFRNRWRYMFRLKIPLNRPSLQPKAFYLGPETELIMQTGKEVVGSNLEDLRLTTTLGYIINPRLTVAAGLMYTTGQTLDNPGIYGQDWTIRMHIYFSPDIRKVKNKLPAIHLFD